jgi:hypothetical protein
VNEERRWWLTDDRWAVAAVIALVGGVIALIGRAWPEAGVFLVAAVVLTIVAARRRRAPSSAG